MFNTDNPITELKEDALGRSFFAKSLGDAILKHKDSNSIAIGLFGGWGTGKTSVVNMALDHIQVSSQRLGVNEKPIIIKFNPWNYSDQDQLILQFFLQLSSVLKIKDHSKTIAAIGDKIELYAGSLVTLPVVGKYLKVVKDLGSLFKKLGVKNISLIKKELNELLGQLTQKIIVVIDDIDRLNDNEIRQIFQLIKSLCDFNNTIYLLSFDKKVVVDALSRIQEGKGEEYLEKVVQVPFELPIAQKNKVEELLFHKLDAVMKDVLDSKWDEVYWGNIYHSGIRHFIESLRDVNRLINTLSFGYELVKTEVHPIDFVAITAIQVFFPDIYYMLRDNKDALCGSSSSYDYQTNNIVKDKNKKIIDEIIGNNSIKNDVLKEKFKNLLFELFPYIRSLYTYSSYSSSFFKEWRSESKICSPDIFDIYFQLSVSENEITQFEINTFIENSNDSSFIQQTFIDLFNKKKLDRFLERLEDFTSNKIPLENINTIVNTITNAGDQFISDEDLNFFALSTDMHFIRIIHQLLIRFDLKKERFNVLKNAISSAVDSLYIAVHSVIIYCQEQGKYDLKSKPVQNDNFTFESDQLEELENITKNKINFWAENGLLLNHKKLPSILSAWKRWDKEKQLVTYLTKITQNVDSIILFITSFVHKSKIYRHGDYVDREQIYLNYKSISYFIDASIIEPTLRTLYNSSNFSQLPVKSKLAITHFLEFYDGKRKNDEFD